MRASRIAVAFLPTPPVSPLSRVPTALPSSERASENRNKNRRRLKAEEHSGGVGDGPNWLAEHTSTGPAALRGMWQCAHAL